MFRLLIAVGLVGVGAGFPTDAFCQSKEINDAYNIYRTVPATSDTQLGVVDEGFFGPDRVTLRLKQRICSAPPASSMPNGGNIACAPQANVTATTASSTKFAFIAALKAIFGLDVSAQKFSVSQINITNACIQELSLEESMQALDRRSCLLAMKAARRDYTEMPLQERLATPGEYYLMFQTTRLMKADVTYTLKVNQGVGITAGLKDLAVQSIGRVANASAVISHESAGELTVVAKGVYIALGPRYYEELYLPEAEAVVARRNVEALARRGSGRRGGTRKSPAPTIKAVEAAGSQADARLARQLEALQ